MHTPQTHRTPGRTIARLALVAVTVLASLLAFSAAAAAVDGPVFEIEEQDDWHKGVACGPADNNGNSTCADHDCSPISGACTIIWYCKHGSGGETLGVCPVNGDATGKDIGDLRTVERTTATFTLASKS